MEIALEAKNLVKKFDQFTAVDQLSFTVPQGSIFGFLGPNGSGKSTTLRMILSLIYPSEGDINIWGHSIKKNKEAALKSMGSIIEKPDFYKYLSAIDNLKLMARASQVHLSGSEINTLLERVGLQDRGKDKVKTFSHGMKQRLGLAQALLHKPSLIILDEPNTGLDPLGIIELRNIILELNKKEGTTIVFSSHILSEVEEICDDLLLIHKGKKIVEGKVHELLSHQDLLVNIEVENQNELLQFIENSEWKKYLVQILDTHVQMNLAKYLLPEFNLLIAQNNFKLISCSYKRRLEEYFLKLTKN